MGREIERKFRVADDSWRQRARSSERLRQGYLAAETARSVRVRLGEGRAAIAIKGATRDATRDEFEYLVSTDDAERMLERLCLRPLIEKTRHCVEHAGHEWVVDEFHGAHEGLVLAEIELESEDEPFEAPPWLGAELTGDPRFYNANLVRRGAPCAHASCGCRAEAEHAPYCGTYCANAAHDSAPEGACSCEHAACTEAQRVPPGREEPKSAIGPDPASPAGGAG